MASPPKRHAPSGIGTTGTTGIILTTNDMVMWTNRIRKEDPVHAAVNPDGFTVRNALRAPTVTQPPQRWHLVEATGIDFEKMGIDPNSRDAKDALLCISKRRALPRNLHAFSETSLHDPGFALVKPGPPPGSTAPSRPETLPPRLRPSSTYAALLPCLNSAADKRQRRRERALDDAEASIEQAMARSRSFLNKAGTQGVFRPRTVTDATAFDDVFIKKVGVPLYTTRPPDTPVLKCKSGLYAPPWAP
mmetsp:Transcript_31051/g.89743  ORF Transcript_31051/g.89743 Transcript_31051/m.89743 type:complete len:247 (-) Transcript_31051:205-945(-)